MADVLRRYYELKGYKAFLSTGTDEHGMKIQQAAAKSNEKPILFCDKVSQRFRELFEAADISYTTFIRTTEKRHATAVADFWKRLADNGHIYKGKHEGWYAVSDEAFYADSQVHEVVEEKTGEKYMASVESGQRVEWMAEENYKFRLSAFQGKLLEWLESNPQVIVPKNRFNEVHSWIKSDLSDLSVSRPRSRLDWGIPVPGDSDHTIYVWLDALINYMTVTGYPWTEGAQRPAEYGAWPADVHLVGKDIIRFHAIYWPAFLMAADLPLPRQIIAHSHWTMGKQKMSKSRGNVADPFEAMQKYGVDPIRYYLIRDGGITDDGDYSDGSITTRHRKDLAGQLGNLVSRSMADSLNPSGLVPRASEKLDMRDATLTDKLEKLSGQQALHRQRALVSCQRSAAIRASRHRALLFRRVYASGRHPIAARHAHEDGFVAGPTRRWGHGADLGRREVRGRMGWEECEWWEAENAREDARRAFPSIEGEGVVYGVGSSPSSNILFSRTSESFTHCTE
ncbi:tRNA synthetases class I (M)-domain-containing protein [Endogone sp. FLAS-F59071]|nr:tRNA synthetases class I (M)-domain-containing protein [Endogone sp. FLAS-F59071]|eukprot:RUS20369.1 tRNA synthetases class I (M)-domain-containing protein [Endogone sp. FLAS-F59071]